MGVRLGRLAAQRIADATGTFAVQVVDPSDLEAAVAAMRLARVDLLGLAAGAAGGASARAGDRAMRPSVSPVVSTPGGPLLLVEHLTGFPELAASIPTMVVDRLEKAGIESATVDIPVRGGALDALDAVSNAVVLRLFPAPRGAATFLPFDWLDMAAEWVTGDSGGDEPVMLRVLGIEFEVAGADLGGSIRECGAAQSWCDAVNGTLDDRVRTASLTFGRLPHLALAAAGPLVDASGQLARFHLLQEISRELAADVAYACIDFEPTLEGLAMGLSPSGWQSQGGAPPNAVARELVDERVPDAYPYQVLGPGHLDRLAGRPLPAEPLGDGRVEVSFEHPRSWLAGSPARDDAQATAWDRLEPLLVTTEELPALLDARGAREPPDDSLVVDVDLAALGSVPDLDAIVLEPDPHALRGTRLSLLELVSWLSHEDHTDAPECVSPVLRLYARWLAAGLDDPTRQRLKQLAPRLISTAPASDHEERARRWLAAEALVRVHAPAWLRAAGLAEAADRLESLGPLREHLVLVDAVDILGSAIAIASRRLEITASIVSDGTVEVQPDEPLVWAAWERVTESTGWIAASEAATYGAAAELTYATDFRVIECSRDRRAREELEASHTTIGDSAWTTALHAVAAEAWERGWQAADAASRELSGLEVRAEMKRLTRAAYDDRSEWDEDDDPESALVAAERAARDSLTRAALAGRATATNGEALAADEHPWDAARNAARASTGGKEWAIVSDEARHSIGEAAWAQAMVDARVEVGKVLEGAADTVARTVVAAVAREASSASGRGVALRAASVARANDGDEAAAEAAANAALDAIARRLQIQAIALLERMIDPSSGEPVIELRGETGAMAPVPTQHSQP